MPPAMTIIHIRSYPCRIRHEWIVPVHVVGSRSFMPAPKMVRSQRFGNPCRQQSGVRRAPRHIWCSAPIWMGVMRAHRASTRGRAGPERGLTLGRCTSEWQWGFISELSRSGRVIGGSILNRALPALGLTRGHCTSGWVWDLMVVWFWSTNEDWRFRILADQAGWSAWMPGSGSPCR